MIGEDLVNIMIQDGVDIPAEERPKVENDLEKEVTDGMVHIIKNEGQPIGFMTYIEDNGKLFIDYLFIFKAFRNRLNLVGLRKSFREKYSQFKWLSRRRKHYFCAG